MPKYFRAWKAGSAVALAAVAVVGGVTACGDGDGAAAEQSATESATASPLPPTSTPWPERAPSPWARYVAEARAAAETYAHETARPILQSHDFHLDGEEVGDACSATLTLGDKHWGLSQDSTWNLGGNVASGGVVGSLDGRSCVGWDQASRLDDRTPYVNREAGQAAIARGQAFVFLAQAPKSDQVFTVAVTPGGASGVWWMSPSDMTPPVTGAVMYPIRGGWDDPLAGVSLEGLK